jgi:hypothetical protein
MYCFVVVVTILLKNYSKASLFQSDIHNRCVWFKARKVCHKLRINHNISAMITRYSLGRSNNGLNKSLERLSTGLRINRAADDAGGAIYFRTASHTDSWK